MLFTEPAFFIFFLAVFSIHWLLQRNTLRKKFLLAASYVFYGAWDWRFLFLIFSTSLIGYGVGLALENQERPGRRRLLLLISLIANLGVLGFFKYFNFFIESANTLFAVLGFGEQRTFSIILPVGISFFTFQTMSYTIDVYRRQLGTTRSFTDFALYVSFFPQLVAGPIVRAADFLPQLPVRREFRDVALQPLLTLFLIGYIKKACLSDSISLLVDPVFAQPDSYNALAIWIATLFYAIQIYCDFSGYTDMAIAVGGLLGYKLPLNFNFPYFSQNIAEFWRRWHISLSTWLRDYLYISLGGNRKGHWQTYRNLLITMLLGGLWHGAAWNFVIWGGLHGALLAAHRRFNEIERMPRTAKRLLRILGLPLTFYFTALAWIFFRAQNLSSALAMATAFLTGTAPGTKQLSAGYLIGFAALAVAHCLAMRFPPPKLAERMPPYLFSALYAVAWAGALLFVRNEARPFIYFQF